MSDWGGGEKEQEERSKSVFFLSVDAKNREPSEIAVVAQRNVRSITFSAGQESAWSHTRLI